jgi:peptide/nickel transport system substrate-binding protein
LGIDEEAIVKHVMNSYAFPAGQCYPSAVFGYDQTINRAAYNPQKARELLNAAGYPDGFEITLDSPNDRYVNDEKIAQAIASSLAKIGLKIKVNAIPKKTFFPMTDRREASFFLIGWSCGDGDASAFLDGIAHTYDADKGFGRYNRGRYSNPKVDQLIEAAGATVKQEERLRDMKAAQRLILADAAFIPLHFQVDLYAKSKKLDWNPPANHYFWYKEMALR